MAIIVCINIPLLESLPLFFRARQDHGTIRTVHLEEDGVLSSLLVHYALRVHQLLVLIVGKEILHHHVQHCPRVGDGHT